MADGFGILHELYLGQGELGRNIIIIYGMNETGKSTLLDFIKVMLFGWKVRDGRVREPLRGGRPGGYLTLMDANKGLYRIERRPRGKQGSIVTVTMPDGRLGDEKLLGSQVLRGITPLVFRNVFGFGVDELRRLEELSADEVSAHVYGAGAGLAAGKLTSGTKRLQEGMNDLFRPAGIKPAINQLLRELAQAEEAVRLLQKEPEQYGWLKQEVLSLRADRGKFATCKRDAELRKRHLEALIKARESWLRLQEARLQLAALPPLPAFPEYGVERLQALEDKIRDVLLALADNSRLVQELRRRIDAIRFEYRLPEYAGSVKALEQERGLQMERMRSLPEQTAEMAHAEEEYKKQINKLGHDFDQARLISIDISLPARQVVENFQSKFADRQRRREKAGEEEARLKGSVGEKEWLFQNAAGELAAHKIPGSPGAKSPEERAAALDRLESGLRRFVQIESALTGARTRLGELEQQKKNAENELAAQQFRLLPLWLLLVLLVLGAGFIVAAFNIGQTAGFLALAAGIAFGITVILAERRAGGLMRARRAGLEESIGRVSQGIAAAVVELEQLTRQSEVMKEKLQAAALAATGRLAVREEEIPALRRTLQEETLALARAEDIKRVVAQAKRALDRERQKLSEANQELAQADEMLAGLGGQWLAWLQEHDLPRDLAPAGVLAYYAVCEEAGKSYQAWQKSVALAGETRRQSELFLSHLNSLLTDIGHPLADMETACHRVLRLEELVSETVRLAEQKERLQMELAELGEQKLSRENTLKALQNEMEALLAAGGAVDPEDFRHRATVYAERKRLVGEIEIFQRELQIIAGLSGESRQLEQDLEQSEGADNERELNDTLALLEGLEGKIKQTDEQIGRLDNQIGMLEQGEELAVRLQEKEMLLTALQSKAGEWQTQALCLWLLKKAKERHERERQPAVLQKASGYLGPMTGNVYERVIAPLGQSDRLEVESPKSGRIVAASLSRGAASQLYLAVRLALAGQYGGAGLPVILDDILVDFDRVRLRGAVRVLGEFSRSRQVILFTCHEHILEAFQECAVDITMIRLSGGVWE